VNVFGQVTDLPSTRYHGVHSIEGMEDGFLFTEADSGNLQSYIDSLEGNLQEVPKYDWCIQLAKSVAYVHEHGIVHSNLSTTNVLVHRTGQTTRLILADFGGSRCSDLV
jgi:serine/threonine protein kinase